LPLNTNLSII